MTIVELGFMAVALAMDCFTISIALGVILRKWQARPIVTASILFGLFQALMPLMGWGLVRSFTSHTLAYGQWGASGLLFFLGLRMVWHSLRNRHSAADAPELNPHRLFSLLMLAVATSVDAFAVGVSMALMPSYASFVSLLFPLLVIGCISLLLTVVGYLIGITIGNAVSRIGNPEMLGGVILMFIAIRILL